MRKSGYLPNFLISFVVFATALAIIILHCFSCEAGDNSWMVTSIVLPEDAPKSEMDLSLTSPQLARFRNLEFNSSVLKRASANAANESSNHSLTPESNISLEYIRAMPNPVNSGRPVTLAVLFEHSSSNLQFNKEIDNPLSDTNGSQMTVKAIIKNSAGIEVQKVDLEYLSNENYIGIWRANVTTGVYNVSIDTLASDKLMAFADALKMRVI